MRIGINLLWLKPKSMGGVEIFAKNLIHGFKTVAKDEKFVIFVNDKALGYLKKWTIPRECEIITKEIDPFSVPKMLLYQYLNVGRLANLHKIDVLYHPTPIFPLRKIEGVKQVVTFHDLQFLHYPQYANYFQRKKYAWSWRESLKNADKIIAISNFTKNDILRNFKIKEDRVDVIYNPVVISEKSSDFSEISRRFGIKPKGYFYTISSLLPHKNTEVLIRLMGLIHEEKSLDMPDKLVISGVGKIQGTEMQRIIEEKGIRDRVIFTGFVEEEEKRSLIENCYCFLFPSLFEGFGMPPVEALMLEVPVITTRAGALEEVTMKLASYVDDPKDEKKWLAKIKDGNSSAEETKNSSKLSEMKELYSREYASRKYLNIFRYSLHNNRRNDLV